MRRLAILAALVTVWPAVSHAERFGATLTGYQEVPSVSTVAVGEFVVHTAGDWNSMEYELSYAGLQGTVLQAHIHFAESRVNGPIVIWLCGTTSNPGPAGTQTCPQSGTVRGTVTAVNVLASPSTQQLPVGAIGQIISAFQAGAAYVNVHTNASPGGEIRGQIQ